MSASPSSSRRPATIAELGRRARNHPDDCSGIKAYLRLADTLRRDGKDLADRKQYELAFVCFARAASIVLEKIPSHKDYDAMLKQQQRLNLTLNGQEMLDSLGALKPILVEHYEEWAKHHPEELEKPAGPTTSRAEAPRQSVSRAAKREDVDRQRQAEDEERRAMEKKYQDEAALWRQQREEASRRDEGERRHQASHGTPSNAAVEERKAQAMLSAKAAAGLGSAHTTVAVSPQPNIDYDAQRRQQEAMQRHEAEIIRQQKAGEEARRQQQQAGIMSRHQESENLAIAERQNIHGYNLNAMPQSQKDPAEPYQVTASGIRIPAYVDIHPDLKMTDDIARTLAALPPPPYGTSYSIDPRDRTRGSAPNAMPLESPDRMNEFFKMDQVEPRRRPPARAPSYPPPITTTSPPPVDGYTIQYPELMSTHQLNQGYAPSLNSMFVPTTHPVRTMDSSLLFPSPGPEAGQPLYHNVLPPASNHSPYHASTLVHNQAAPSPKPSKPSKHKGNAPDPPSVQRWDGPVSVELKSVYIPRDALPRFLSIAQVNTTLNRETCGLLLGRDKGGRFIVSTLLIPRQSATSDTCTMEEEELVMMFTEERGLITLGWIHTHPSQSCFMSSVDLHTHSGFQRMLPESFAVVCAPKSTPNFGIFRLTDPPGLKTVLECTAKEAFHPHPDVPIYTDADKGHVQMKDLPIEIVDLR